MSSVDPPKTHEVAPEPTPETATQSGQPTPEPESHSAPAPAPAPESTSDPTPEPTAAPIPVDPVVRGAETDDESSDTDSLYTSSTASLTESIREYREIHGRTFTQKTEYWAPNDETQNDALDFNHYWITDFFDGKLFLAPLGDHPQRILDLGTGTGIWAVEMADKFPSAEVIGTDVSPIQPSWVPPNCKFEIDDFEQEWTWPKDHFDFIHARNLEACFSDVSKTVKEIYDHTKPGGYFEILEFDSRAYSQADLGEDHIFNKWYRYITESQEKLEKSQENVSSGRFRKCLSETGFVDIVERKWQIPIGTWPAKPDLKRLGHCNLMFMDQSLEGFMLFVLKEVLRFSSEEVHVTVSELRAAIRNPKNTPYYYMHVLHARKPLEDEK